MKRISLLFSLLILLAQGIWATTYYSSNGNSPNLTASWWTTTGGTGSHPSNFTTSADIFNIQAGHTMTSTANWSVSGTVQINGTLVASNTITIGTMAVNSGGTYQHNINGGAVPTATWDLNSTLLVTGITSSTVTGITGQSLGNLTWNCTGQTSGSSALSGTLTVNGNLTVLSSGSYQFRVQTSPITVKGNLNIAGGGMYVAGQAAKVMIVGGDVTVSDDTLNISAGTSSSYNGVLTIAGDLTITGTGVVTETGSTTNSGITFNGTTLQTLTNSGTLSGALNYCFNNASGFVLGSNWAVTLADTMKSGNIDLNGHTLTLGSSTSSPGTLLWTSGLITGTGTFTRWFGTSAITIGNVAGLFPMGIGIYNRNVWIGGTPSTGGTVSVQHTDAAGTTTCTFTENSQSFTKRTNMNWLLSTANSFAGSSLSLRLQGSGMAGIVQVSDLNISAPSGACSGTYSAPGGTTSNPLVNRTGLSQTTLANTFHIAATANSPLPVELTSFTGNVKAGIVTLNWNTSTEVGNFGFNVERSSNGQDWQNIGFIQGAGNSNSVKKYSFVDNTAKARKYSYRLKQVDNNGAYTYSQVIEVSNSVQPTSFSVGNYPNPFNPSTIIRYALPVDAFVKITICNILGQTITTIVNQNMEQGVHEVSFNASNFTSGTYIYRIEAGSFTATKKMLLIK
jgi:hypothetical protein